MGEKDILEKKLLMFNDVFADFADGIKSCFYCLIRKGGKLGEKDVLEKKLLMFNDVFADFEDGIKSYFYCLIRKGDNWERRIF